MNLVDAPPKLADAPPIVDAALIAAAQADAYPSKTPADPGAAHAAAPAAARVIDYDAEARDLIAFAAALFFPLRPKLAEVYTPEVQERIAEAGAPLLRKYKIDLSMLGPELTFAIVVIPLIAPTIAALKVTHEKTQEKTDSKNAAGIVGAEVNATESPLDRFPGIHAGAS